MSSEPAVQAPAGPTKIELSPEQMAIFAEYLKQQAKPVKAHRTKAVPNRY